jgi:putative transposase
VDEERRRSIRLPSYDYGNPGAYFVTICAYRRRPLFAHTPFAEIATREWQRAAELRASVTLDAFVVMPNHIHGIVWIIADGIRGQRAAPLFRTSRGPTPNSLGAVVRAYKSAVARCINVMRNTPAQPVWQRNYYEHVIRDERDLERVRRYVEENPLRWEFDRDNPEGRPDRVEMEFWSTRRGSQGESEEGRSMLRPTKEEKRAQHAAPLRARRGGAA